jgi:hypothetical protein
VQLATFREKRNSTTGRQSCQSEKTFPAQSAKSSDFLKSEPLIQTPPCLGFEKVLIATALGLSHHLLKFFILNRKNIYLLKDSNITKAKLSSEESLGYGKNLKNIVFLTIISSLLC